VNALLLGLWCVSAISPPPSGHWAKDTSGKISAPTLQALDEIAEGVNRTGNGQLGVLVVKTTGGTAHHAFATGVFNQWGIGHREHKNGILLFVALDDRKAEIILGDGLMRITTGDTDAVMRDQVVSHFKAGKPEQALLEGAKALAALLTSAQPQQAAESPHGVSTQDALSEERVSELFRTGEISDPSPRKWVIDLTGEVPAETVHALERLPNELYASDERQLFIVFFRSRNFDAAQVRERALSSLSLKHPRAALLAVNLQRPDTSFAFPPELQSDSRAPALAAEIENAARYAPTVGNVIESNLRAGPVLINGFPARSPSEVVGEAVEQHGTAFAGFGGLMLIGGAIWGRRWNRYRSRTCESCQRPRQMLPAGAEDTHLSDGQKTEQSVKSIDYDVWWCGLCRTVLVLNNSAWFSGYARCKGCSNKTLSSKSTTITHATEYSGGLVRVDEKCAHCSYTNSYTRATARITRSSTSSSSSSSRSSFGGGSSSGRGSSGSW
jgi:uncharacterized membrane protein YgcG